MDLKHDISLPIDRVHDKPLMVMFPELQLPQESILQLNKCRLYLQVYFLSDCFTLDGTSVRHHIVQGEVGPTVNE